MSVSTPPCIFLPFFHPVMLFPFATAGCCRSGKISIPHEASSSSDTENDPARTTGNNYSRASTFHLLPINYEYRPKDCSLSGAYPSVWRTWEGIRFQRRLFTERRSFLAMTAMIDKRQRARGETRFRLKGPQKRPTVVRYRWAISGRNARRRSVEGLSKPRLTRRRIQRTRMIYRSKVGIIPLSYP